MTLSLSPDAVEALLVFYRDAGVDIAVGEEPVDRFAEADAELARRRPPPAGEERRERPATPAVVRPQPVSAAGAPPCIHWRWRPRAKPPVPPLPHPRCAARHRRGLRGLCAEGHRLAHRVRGRRARRAGHVRRRGAGARGGPRGPALRRPLRPASRPDARRRRPRPEDQRLYRQRHPLVLAGQPHADAAGNPSANPSSGGRSNSRHRTCWSASVRPRRRPCSASRAS